METNNTSQTYGYRNPTMKHAVRNRGGCMAIGYYLPLRRRRSTRIAEA
ncbi:MAG: hypothetical protein IKM35_02810 [Bacteroidaceae bacterium]|nr:hypothetical protein [Bacteroidaceae bacterium]